MQFPWWRRKNIQSLIEHILSLWASVVIAEKFVQSVFFLLKYLHLGRRRRRRCKWVKIKFSIDKKSFVLSLRNFNNVIVCCITLQWEKNPFNLALESSNEMNCFHRLFPSLSLYLTFIFIFFRYWERNFFTFLITSIVCTFSPKTTNEWWLKGRTKAKLKVFFILLRCVFFGILFFPLEGFSKHKRHDGVTGM